MAEKKVTATDAQTFPKPPEPAAEEPQAGEPKPSRYFVILHDGVGAFTRDKIAKGEDLGDADAIKRLLDLGAIKPTEG